MKFKIGVLIALLIPSILFAKKNNIIPVPKEVVEMEGVFTFSKEDLIINIDPNLKFEASCLSELFKKELKIDTKIISGNKESRIQLSLDKTISNEEAYKLNISNKGIFLSAKTRRGIFYGIQTLRQWMWANYNTKERTIAAVDIDDCPRYSYRALMLDPARHFLPLDGLKKYIDMMAIYKFNRLHLHLSDDQGWRMEIKKYPRLTTVGAVRKETDGDGRPHAGYYTQEDMKELVQYAAQRHVAIIPEIDVPGHSVAAIAAYPTLTCFDDTIEVRTTPGVSKDLLCAGNDTVFQFLDDVISELAGVFTGEEFHIGGDEAPLDHWETCSKCQARMNNHKLESPQHLMSYFFERVNQSLMKNHKRPLVWYELDVPFYPSNSTMYSWRMGLSKKVISKAGKMGYHLISCPGEHAYFDYPQGKGEETCDWMPYLTLENVYQFDPCMGLDAAECSHIIGVEATLWGEYIKDIDRAFYMTWPRAMALIEAGWSQAENRDWQSFQKRLPLHLKHLKQSGVNYRNPSELGKPFHENK